MHVLARTAGILARSLGQRLPLAGLVPPPTTAILASSLALFHLSTKALAGRFRLQAAAFSTFSK